MRGLFFLFFLSDILKFSVAKGEVQPLPLCFRRGGGDNPLLSSFRHPRREEGNLPSSSIVFDIHGARRGTPPPLLSFSTSTARPPLRFLNPPPCFRSRRPRREEGNPPLLVFRSHFRRSRCEEGNPPLIVFRSRHPRLEEGITLVTRF